MVVVVAKIAVAVYIVGNYIAMNTGIDIYEVVSCWVIVDRVGKLVVSR